MSITIELSPEIEKQLAAMSEEERTRFLTEAVVEKLEDEDDPAVWAIPGDPENRVLSPEAAAAFRAASEEPLKEPTETMKKAIRLFQEMTGRTLGNGEKTVRIEQVIPG